MKDRLFGLLLFVFCAGMLLLNWYTAINSGYYYVKMSFISPVGMLFGLALLIFGGMKRKPLDGPKPKPSATRALVALVVIFGGLGLGIALGLANVYLLEHNSFK
jgi:hypothetical protein